MFYIFQIYFFIKRIFKTLWKKIHPENQGFPSKFAVNSLWIFYAFFLYLILDFIFSGAWKCWSGESKSWWSDKF